MRRDSFCLRGGAAVTHTIVLHRVRAAALIFVLAVPLVPWPVQGAQVHGVDEQRIDLPSLIRELETANPEIKAARQRIRPMAMAGLANILGLIPVMWATGTGADVMKRLAAPMVGGCSPP